MALKQLLQHYLQNDDAVDSFDRDPEGAFERFAVTHEERELLRSANPAGEAGCSDPELADLLDRVRARRPYVRLLYPDADLKIVGVTEPPGGIVAGKLAELYIELTWDHDEQPVSGLPSFAQICARHRDDTTVPKIRVDTTPVLVDLLGRVHDAGGSKFAPLMALREALVFPKAGVYQLHIGMTKYPAESDPVLVTVADAR